MQELSKELMAIIIPALTTLVGLLVAWGLAELRRYIATRNLEIKKTSASETLTSLIETAVISVNQTLRDDITWKLSPDEKRHFKNAAVDIVNKQLTDDVVNTMSLNVKDLPAYVDKRIEESVSDLKPYKQSD